MAAEAHALFLPIRSRPARKNNSVYPKLKSAYMIAHPVPPRGALAIVFERWNGERWTLTAPLTKAPDADGEVVWS